MMKIVQFERHLLSGRHGKKIDMIVNKNWYPGPIFRLQTSIQNFKIVIAQFLVFVYILRKSHP